MQDNVRDEHMHYQKKMDAWFKEQLAIIESDLLDMDHAKSSAILFRKKADLYDQQEAQGKLQHEADLASYESAKKNFDKYLSQFKANGNEA